MTATGRSGSVSSHDTSVELVDRDLALAENDRLARPRHRVGAAAGDLDRAERRRPLRDRSGQRRPWPASTAVTRRRGAGTRRQLALEVVGRGRGAEADGRAIRLPIAEVVLDHPGPVAEEDRQDARGERVQGSAVTDALGRRQATDQAHHVVRRRAGRLGHDDDPVEARDRATICAIASGSPRRPAGWPRPARRDAPRPAAPRSWRPAARAWPPPPNRPVRTVASTPPGPRPDADPRARAGFLEQDRHLGRLGL